MTVNIGLFKATVKDAKPYISNDQHFRQFLEKLEGETVEIVVRRKSDDKYSLLTKEWRKEMTDFLTTFDEGEASAFVTWTQNGEDSLDIARHLAELRLAKGADVPENIIRFFRLDRENRLFPDTASNKSIGEAVSA